MSKNKDRILKIKPKPASVQLLERQLHSNDAEVRKVGWDSIHRIGAPVEPLTDCVAACLDHQNWFVKASGAEACCRSIQSKGAGEVAVKSVAGTRMSNPDAEVRRCAGQALVRIVEDASTPDAPTVMSPKMIPQNTVDNAVKEMAAILSHQDPRIRQNAIEAIGRIGPHSGTCLDEVMSKISDPDVSVRNAVIGCCASLGPLAATCAEQIAKHLRSPDKDVRRSATRAIHTLEQHSGAEAAAAVAGQVEKCADAAQRRYLLLVLIDMKELAAPHGKLISDLLDDPDPGVRHTVVRLLVSAGPMVAPYSLKYVKRRLESPDADVRRSATDAMRAMSPIAPSYAQSVGKLLHEEQADPTEENIRYKINILTILGGAAANAEPYLEELAEHLGDKDWGIRRAAIEALADLGEHATEAAAEVARRLLHHEPDVRRAAAECLGGMGVHAGAYGNRVKTMVDTEEDDDVRQACERACALLAEAGALGHSDSPLNTATSGFFGRQVS